MSHVGQKRVKNGRGGRDGEKVRDGGWERLTALQQRNKLAFSPPPICSLGLFIERGMEEVEDRGTCGPSSQHTTRDPISINRHDDSNSCLKLPRAMQWSALVGTALEQ